MTLELSSLSSLHARLELGNRTRRNAFPPPLPLQAISACRLHRAGGASAHLCDRGRKLAMDFRSSPANHPLPNRPLRPQCSRPMTSLPWLRSSLPVPSSLLTSAFCAFAGVVIRLNPLPDSDPSQSRMPHPPVLPSGVSPSGSIAPTAWASVKPAVRFARSPFAPPRTGWLFTAQPRDHRSGSATSRSARCSVNLLEPPPLCGTPPAKSTKNVISMTRIHKLYFP